jgi:isomerase DpgB
MAARRNEVALVAENPAGPLGEAVDGYLRIDNSEPLSPALVSSVGHACDRAEDAGGDALLVVHVVAGSRPHDGEFGVQLVSKWERALRRLERIAATTVTVAEGDCAGPALEALLTTDYRIATPGVRLLLGGDPWPGMAVHRLVNQIGLARARSLVLFGHALIAEQALAVGLVDEVVEDVPARLASVVKLVGGRDGVELAIRRRLMLDAVTTSFEESLGVHLAACDRTLRNAR